jgi:protein O-mannosyl-transferase
VTLATFLPVLQSGFVNWDDPANFLNNPSYRGLGPRHLWWMLTAVHMGHWIPVTWLTLGVDYVLWGMDARGYHLTSLLFHAATAVAFYALAYRLLERALPPGTRPTDINLGAAAAALLFAVHPLRVESVAWVTERRDVVSGLFFVATLLAYLKMIEAPAARRRGWYLASLGLYALALLSKSITVALPVVLLVLDVYPLGRLGFARGWARREVWLEKIPYVVLAALVAIRAVQAVPDSAKASLEVFGLGPRLLVSVHGLAFYLGKTVWPAGLSPLYAYTTQVGWATILGVLGGIILVVATWRRWPALAATALTYVALVLPALGLFAAGPQAVADRYSYLPCLGWALLVGGVVAYRTVGAVAVRTAAAAALVALVVLTAQQTRVWRDSVSLWSHALRIEPGNRFAHLNLGGAYLDQGRMSEAIDQYKQVLKLSRDKAPWYAVVGWLYARSGLVAEGLPYLLSSLELEPGRPDACANAREAVRLLRVPPPPELGGCPPAG